MLATRQSFIRTISSTRKGGLYAGILVQLLAEPPKRALRFLVNKYLWNVFNRNKISHAIFVEVIAGFIEGIYTAPIEVIRLLTQLDLAKSSGDSLLCCLRCEPVSVRRLCLAAGMVIARCTLWSFIFYSVSRLVARSYRYDQRIGPQMKQYKVSVFSSMTASLICAPLLYGTVKVLQQQQQSNVFSYEYPMLLKPLHVFDGMSARCIRTAIGAVVLMKTYQFFSSK